MAGKLAWFPMLVEDWLTSRLFLESDTSVHGLFWNAMASMWTSSSCGITEKSLRAIARKNLPQCWGLGQDAKVIGLHLDEHAEIERITEWVLAELVPHPDPAQDGMLTHPKLYDIWVDARGSAKMTHALRGKLGGLANAKRAQRGKRGRFSPSNPSNDQPEPEPEPEPPVQRELPIGRSSGNGDPFPAPPEEPPKDPPWKPAHDYVSDWNALAKKLKVRGIQALTPHRKKHLKARERDGLAKAWPDIVRQLEASKTWVGGFRGFCFDWIIRNADNFTKVAEGKYADRDAKGKPTHRRHELDHDDSAYDGWLNKGEGDEQR